MGRAHRRDTPGRARSHSSIRPGIRVHFACEVKDLEATAYVDYKASRRMDRFTHLALAAARQAEATPASHRADRRARRRGRCDRDRRPELFEAASTSSTARPLSGQSLLDRADHPQPCLRWVSIQLRTGGPLLAECTACAASRWRSGTDGRDPARPRDVMFCGHGGAGDGEHCRVLRQAGDSRRDDTLSAASRPFDGERTVSCWARVAPSSRDRGGRAAQPRPEIYAELLGPRLSHAILVSIWTLGPEPGPWPASWRWPTQGSRPRTSVT